MTREQVIRDINLVIEQLEMNKLLLVYHFALGLAAGMIEPKKRGRRKNESK